MHLGGEGHLLADLREAEARRRDERRRERDETARVSGHEHARGRADTDAGSRSALHETNHARAPHLLPGSPPVAHSPGVRAPDEPSTAAPSPRAAEHLAWWEREGVKGARGERARKVQKRRARALRWRRGARGRAAHRARNYKGPGQGSDWPAAVRPAAACYRWLAWPSASGCHGCAACLKGKREARRRWRRLCLPRHLHGPERA